IVHFTAILSTISIIEDRREGFLQSVLASPASRAAIVMGKMLGGTSVAVIQGALFLLLAPTVGVSLTIGSFLASAAVLGLVAFALTGLGFVIAWRMDSTQGFHAIMNLFLMPMWFLSGAVFPEAGAPGWMAALIKANPLTYGVSALRAALAGEAMWAPAAITAAFGVVTLAAACGAAGRRTVGAAAAILVALLLTGCDSKLPTLYTVPDFELTNQRGEKFALRDLKGRVWIADFVFTRCKGPCPAMTYRMKQLQEDLPSDLWLVSFSVDPKYDTPERLREYAARYEAADGRWWFLTGEKKKIYDLALDGFKLAAGEEWEREEWVIFHDERFVLVDADGRIRGYYMGTDKEALDRLRSDAGSLHSTTPRPWMRVLPHLNAGLNSTCAVLLMAGLALIKARRIALHKTCMLSALAVSVLFLASYLTYHFAVGTTRFEGEGWVRAAYFSILVSHTILAGAVLPLAGITVWRAFRGNFDQHKAIARWTLPVWLYVSVTGVVVYWMLYHTSRPG
ncbi:MAG TPA: DUF420 domain-containing protein, partial [Planctomycetota bacterium]|nr:DUF420 domain-containing protein [Planctomycetota bacterium]